MNNWNVLNLNDRNDLWDWIKLQLLWTSEMNSEQPKCTIQLCNLHEQCIRTEQAENLLNWNDSLKRVIVITDPHEHLEWTTYMNIWSDQLKRTTQNYHLHEQSTWPTQLNNSYEQPTWQTTWTTDMKTWYKQSEWIRDMNNIQNNTREHF